MSLKMLALRHEAGQTFAKYVAEGLRRHRTARPSHLCIRTADMTTFSFFGRNAFAIGTTILRERDGNPMLWVHLKDPLIYDGYTLEWLEIIAPKLQYPNTGPQMLVYQQDKVRPLKRPARGDSGFQFRYQRQHAATLALAGLG